MVSGTLHLVADTSSLLVLRLGCILPVFLFGTLYGTGRTQCRSSEPSVWQGTLTTDY